MSYEMPSLNPHFSGPEPIYDEKAEPVEIICSECGKPTGEFLQPHAKNCPCWTCVSERILSSRTRIPPAGKTVEFRKFEDLK